jgi:ferrous iron transport protein A
LPVERFARHRRGDGERALIPAKHVEIGAKADGCRALGELASDEGGVLCAHARVGRGRVADLGFVPGTHVKVIRRAPLGDPIEIEIRGYRLCLRSSDLAGLCVRMDAPQAP